MAALILASSAAPLGDATMRPTNSAKIVLTAASCSRLPKVVLVFLPSEEFRRRPGGAAVHADFDRRNGFLAGPGHASDRGGAAGEDRFADGGPRDLRLRLHHRQRLERGQSAVAALELRIIESLPIT